MQSEWTQCRWKAGNTGMHRVSPALTAHSNGVARTNRGNLPWCTTAAPQRLARRVPFCVVPTRAAGWTADHRQAQDWLQVEHLGHTAPSMPTAARLCEAGVAFAERLAVSCARRLPEQVSVESVDNPSCSCRSAHLPPSPHGATWLAWTEGRRRQGSSPLVQHEGARHHCMMVYGRRRWRRV